MANNEKGFSMIETLASMAIMGLVAVAFFSGLSTASKALFTADELETAMNLAQSQMDFIQKQAYAPSYSAAAVPSEYAGYTVAPPSVQNLGDGNIQRISIIVSHQGKPVIRAAGSTLQGYKVN